MKRPIPFIAICLLMLATMLGSQAFAEKNIYRWVDDKGVTHYGDRPAAGAETVRIRRGRPVAPSDKEKAEDEKVSELRKEQCELAQTRFTEYSGSNRIVEKDEFGRERELTPEERLATIAKAKKDVEAFCIEG